MEAFVDVDGEVKEVSLDYFSPDQKIFFATWVTGEIRVPIGEMIEYAHIGYYSKYEKDLIIQIVDGIVITRNALWLNLK